MPSAIGELVDAVSAAVDAGRVELGQAERLMGKLLIDAAAVGRRESDESLRDDLVALGMPADLVDEAQAELQVAAALTGTAVGATVAVERVIKHIELLGDPAEWANATTYDSLAIAVIDAVWSIGVRYAGVLNVLTRYRAARSAEGVDPDHDTPQDLVAFIEAIGGADEFASTVHNLQRTSSRSGILKAEAVSRAAQVLAAHHGLTSPEAMGSLLPEQLDELRTQWTSIPGQTSGISWDYFLMLTGRQGVKADRMVCRFVAEALGVSEQAISPGEAHSIVTDAAARLGVAVSQLDYAIWLHQSGNAPI